MKYAKKFTLVPLTSVQTPAGTELDKSLISSLRMNASAEDKIKVYNQALSKLRELSTNNDNLKQILDDFYATVSKNNIEIVKTSSDIEHEIKETESQAIKLEAAKNLSDYSINNAFQPIQFRQKSDFENPKPTKKTVKVSTSSGDGINNTEKADKKLTKQKKIDEENAKLIITNKRRPTKKDDEEFESASEQGGKGLRKRVKFIVAKC